MVERRTLEVKVRNSKPVLGTWFGVVFRLTSPVRRALRRRRPHYLQSVDPQFPGKGLNSKKNLPTTLSTSCGSKSSEVSQRRGHCSTGKCYCVFPGATYARHLFLLYVSNVGVYYKPTAIEMHDTLLLSTPNHNYDHCKKTKQKKRKKMRSQGTQLCTG